MEFKIVRTCKNCNNKDEYTISKIEAAFSLKDKIIKNKPCTKCSSDKWSSVSYSRPELDKELLDKCGADPNLYFMDQDEDIILAEEENLPLLLEAIDKKIYPKPKLNILLSAICILAYDNIIASEEYTFTENQQRKILADKVINELHKIKHLLTDLNWEIPPYVKDIVLPRLGNKI